MTAEVFNLDQFKSNRTQGIRDETTTLTPKGETEQKEHFVGKPMSWYDKLMPTISPNAWRMVDVLELKSLRHRGSRTFQVGDLSEFGIGRESKASALEELEQVGHIKVTRTNRKAPLVEILKTNPVLLRLKKLVRKTA